jgi:hypothetical protein
MKKLGFSFICMFFIMNCATTYHLSPVIDNNTKMEIIYLDGEEVAISYGNETVVGLLAYKTVQNEIILNIAYKNISQNRINIIPDSITVVGKNDYFSQYLKVYSAEEYLKKLRREQSIILAIQGLAAISESVNSGNSTSTIYGNVGSESVYGTISTYDPAKQSAVSSIKMQELNQTAQTYEYQIKAIEQRLLKINTLFPGQIVEGNVIVKFQDAMKYIVNVPAGNDIHVFEFIHK